MKLSEAISSFGGRGAISKVNHIWKEDCPLIWEGRGPKVSILRAPGLRVSHQAILPISVRHAGNRPYLRPISVAGETDLLLL